MPERAYQISSGVLLLAVLTIAYGGTFVLSVTRGSVPANDLQRTFFRAGHAHAGVLVTILTPWPPGGGQVTRTRSW
jgi:hypothetical protein